MIMPKTVKKRSQKQEKSVAKLLNAKQVVASGALWSAKGDVRNDKFLIECKTTEKDYYPLHVNTWLKIESEALKDGDRIPIMVVDLRDSERYVIFCPYFFTKTTVLEEAGLEFNKHAVAHSGVSKRIKDLEEDEDIKTLSFVDNGCVLAQMRINKFLEVYESEI